LPPADRHAIALALVAYGAAQLFLLWQPLDVSVEPAAVARKFRTGGVVLNPLLSPRLAWESLPLLLADAVISAPAGALAVFVLAKGIAPFALVRVMGSGALFFAAAEAGTLFVRSATADALECMANCLGFTCGVLLVAALETQGNTGPEGRRRVRALTGTALLFTALVYLAYNLTPFDFSASPEFISARLRWLTKVPFTGYYQNPEFKALADAVFKVGLAVPIGVLSERLARLDRRSTGGIVEVGWLLATGLFFTAVEVGQVLLPSRYPDSTDVLLALGGVWLGIRLARLLGRS
jgi:hypothetical protein